MGLAEISLLDRADAWLAQWWWSRPFLMCLIVTGILGYLGTHVLARKVIFVDLATAQIAALGAAYATLLGYEAGHDDDQAAITLFSLGFALAGAAVIAFTRMKKERVPHEAFIGIVYASASALAILVLSKSPGEGEQIKAMLVGSLLPVRLPKLLVTGLICGVVGAFHWFFRRRFYQLTADPEGAERAGISVALWDFLFYVSLGLVITSCVTVAGVLLVFSYLVVPAVIAVMFSERTRVRVVIAWGVGAAVSVAGILISYTGEFPTGPSIVAGFTVALVMAGAIHYVTSNERSGVAAGRLAAGAALVALALWGTTLLRKVEVHAEHHEDDFTRLVKALESDDITLQMDAIDHLADKKDPHAAGRIAALLKRTKSDLIIEHGSHALAKLQAVDELGTLKEVAGRDLDPLLRVEVARSILELRDPAGFGVLIDVLEKAPPAQARRDALALAEERSGLKLDAAALKKWWTERGDKLRFRRETKRFD